MKNLHCFPMVTYAGLAATLGVAVPRVRNLVRANLGLRTISVSRYQRVLLPADVRKFLGPDHPIFIVPAMLFDDEVAKLEKQLGQKLKNLTTAPGLIASIYFDASTLNEKGELNGDALAFMADLELKTYKRFANGHPYNM